MNPGIDERIESLRTQPDGIFAIDRQMTLLGGAVHHFVLSRHFLKMVFHFLHLSGKQYQPPSHNALCKQNVNCTDKKAG